MSPQSIGVVVCIASIGRPSLVQTLTSISQATLPSHVTLSAVIADDSMDNMARRLLDKHGPWNFPVHCIPVGAQNIAAARNACLDAAQGEFLLFVDDDEWVHTAWIERLLAVAEAYQADAVFGPVEAIYPEGTPDWLRRVGPFRKEFATSGERVATGATCNALVRRNTVEAAGLRFRAEFGRTGGEDTDFFARLRAAGGVLVVSADALVYEKVPPERLQMSHLRKRYTRGGQTYARVTLERARAGTKFAFYGYSALKAGAAGMAWAVTRPFRRDLALRYALRTWLNLGKLREGAGMRALRLY